MTYIKQVTINNHEARALQMRGFILKLVSMHQDGTDTYKVYVIGR